MGATARRPERRDDTRGGIRMGGGFTLIELMVVLVIIMILAGLLLSFIRPAVEQRRMKESARMLATMLYHAKARAIESGRPYGIWIERAEDPDGEYHDAARNIFFAQAPPQYAGDTEEARAEMTGDGACRLTGANEQLIRPGDLILFNFQEPAFTVSSAGGGAVQFSSESADIPKTNKEKPSSVPFQILRKPTRTASRPMQLSGDIIVDLSQSGTGIAKDFSFQQAKGREIIIMFSPTGSLERLYKDNKTSRVPASTVHLLLGRNEKRGEENLRDPQNLWVSISPQAGNIATNPNVAADSLAAARRLARTMRTSGGN